MNMSRMNSECYSRCILHELIHLQTTSLLLKWYHFTHSRIRPSESWFRLVSTDKQVFFYWKSHALGKLQFRQSFCSNYIEP